MFSVSDSSFSLSLPQEQPALRVFTMPADANPAGDVFGGYLMSQIDLAGATVASVRARGRVVTVAVKELVFKHPVYVGDILSLYATIVRVGTTSITVEIKVYVQRRQPANSVLLVADAHLVYVAANESGQPRPVPAE